MNKSRTLSRFISILIFITPLVIVGSSAHSSTPSTPSYKFEFDNSFLPTIGSATFGPSASCAGWSCITSGTWGFNGSDGYWQWSGASGSGPNLSLGNYSLQDTYTILIKFSFSNVAGYSRILNFNEGDIGLYFLSGKIEYYNYVTAPAPIYTSNEIVTMSLTRTPQYITLYTSDSVSATTTQRFQYAAGNIAKNGSLTSLPFFTDDGGEFSNSGKVFNVSIWNDRALTSTEINSYLYTPLVPVFQFADSSVSAIYKTTKSITTNTNLPGKVTYFANNKRVAKCISIALSGSASSYSASCNWKPTLHGPVKIKAIFTPSDSSFAAMTIVRDFTVTRRVNTR